MLILTRRGSESFIIGDDIKVTVLSVRGSQVRLGIAAPKDISVHREEIYRMIKEKLGAAATATAAGNGGNSSFEENPGNVAVVNGAKALVDDEDDNTGNCL